MGSFMKQKVAEHTNNDVIVTKLGYGNWQLL